VIDTLVDAARAAGASSIVIAPTELPLESVDVSSRGTAITYRDGDGALALTSSLVGAHQSQNVATAVSVLRAAGAPWVPTASALAAGVSATRLAGRFQRVGPWLFDVAHNPDGVATVVESLHAVAPARPLSAVVCVLSDKDWRGMLDRLLPVVDRLVLTDAPTAPATRRWPLDEVLSYARTHAGAACDVVAERDFGQALEQARAGAATVLVTGSFHTVGDAMQRLEIDPLAG
jgi:dihydrofolate synthase/folylpolyglutamate synthase